MFIQATIVDLYVYIHVYITHTRFAFFFFFIRFVPFTFFRCDLRAKCTTVAYTLHTGHTSVCIYIATGTHSLCVHLQPSQPPSAGLPSMGILSPSASGRKSRAGPHSSKKKKGGGVGMREAARSGLCAHKKEIRGK